MYDLCSRPEQPEPAPEHADMESSNGMEALGKQQEKLNESEKHSNNNDVPKTAKLATKSLLGKRHHSLYANLSGFEAEGVQKVRVKLFMTDVTSRLCLYFSLDKYDITWIL